MEKVKNPLQKHSFIYLYIEELNPTDYLPIIVPSVEETKVQQSRFRSESQDKDPEWRHGPHHQQEVGVSTVLHQVQVKEEMTGAFLWREKERPREHQPRDAKSRG